MRRRAASVLVLVAALPACVSARECAGAIREDLRADTIRYALDKRLIAGNVLPREDYALAVGAGRPFQALSPERVQEIAGPAAGYASCIRERMSR